MLWSNVSISSVTLGGTLAIWVFPHIHFYIQIQDNISIKSGKRQRDFRFTISNLRFAILGLRFFTAL